MLDRLAEHAGIEGKYQDALHQWHETPEEKKRALLKAMELRADTEEEAESTLKQLEDAIWKQVLPPCVVLFAGRDRGVPLMLPAGTDAVRWTVRLESGEERTGEATFPSLKLLQKGSERRERRLLEMPADLPWGYHRLRVKGETATETSLIVSPGQCWLPGQAGDAVTPAAILAELPSPGELNKPSPEDADPETDAAAVRQIDEALQQATGSTERFWGIAVQAYLLRSERNWGIGDFTDLKRLVEIVKAQGGDAVGVNPLHGMFPDLPREASPYSPLSRYLLNVLNLDPEAIPEFAQSEAAQAMVKAPEFQERLRRVREAELVAYEEVAQLKTPVLRALYEEFEKNAPEERKEAFARFQRGCDPLLTESCVFGAIRQHMTEQDLQFRDCGKWPEGLKHAASDGVERFRQEQADLVRYHQWTQWEADEQLFAVKQACEGMAVGLYRDLAVGANPSGAEVWSNPEVMVSMAEVGAPPDLLNTAGQNWVLPPFHPLKMREDGYRSFIALLRTNMRHAGGVRIDHAMALERLYWIPRGGTPRDGGYVRYPTEDLIGVIALESHRNKCLVVGEDLGTVPKGFRERMAEARILSYKVLLLEEEEKGGGYVKGGSYQRLALSTASSHDLPTLRGWWEGEDLRLRERLGFTKPDKARKDEAKREKDRESLVAMLREDGLLQGEAWPNASEFIDAAHGFLARTKAVLMMAQIEDVVAELHQVNLPASMPDQYPSWSRRLPITLEELARDPRLQKLSAIAKRERGSEA